MKKLLISLLVAGVLVGTVYGAAASLSVTGTETLGSGTEAVATCDTVTNVTYVLDGDDPSLLASVDFNLADTSTDPNPCNGAAYSLLLEADGTVYTGTLVAPVGGVANIATAAQTAEAVDQVTLTLVGP